MTKIEITKDVGIPMRDGVVLRADVYRRTDIAKAPVLLQRLPYDKDGLGITPDLFRYVGAGYAMVVQDTRGRFASDGTFSPFREGEDGADTVEWCSAQSWSSGDVGMLGMSYWGATQWQAAVERPHGLRGISPFITAADYFDGWTYEAGALRLGFALFWAYNLAVGEATRRLRRGEGDAEPLLEAIAAWDRVSDLVWRMPLCEMPHLDELAPYWREWLDHPTYGDYWRQVAPRERYADVDVPSLNIGGWYDLFLGGTLQNYVGAKSGGGTPAARKPRLVIGPWAHAAQVGQFVERSFGLLAGVPGMDLTGLQIQWFDEHVKGEVPQTSAAPVRIFVMGLNEWRDEEDWPLPDTSWTTYYLHSDGAANTRSGDGTLTPETPAQEREDVYVYDPRHPVPTIGGATLTDFIGANAGPRDQGSVEDRSDVLCYTSEILDRDVEVTGPVELILYVSSSAVDSDFTGKLVDVHPDGRAEILTDGIVRGRFRESLVEPEMMKPGRIYEVRVNLVATSNLFRAGHRMRIEVSSSNFPKFDRNTNTGGTISTEADHDMVRAVNRVFHDHERPSRLVLPVIDRT